MSLLHRANQNARCCRVHTEGRDQLIRQRTNPAISQSGDDCGPPLTMRVLHGDVVRILVYPMLGVQMDYVRLVDHGSGVNDAAWGRGSLVCDKKRLCIRRHGTV